MVYGVNVGGPNEEVIGGHTAAWDIFDNVKTIANVRPGSGGPATVNPTPVGFQSYRMVREHEKMELNENEIFRNRRLGAAVGTVDVTGQNYITQQQSRLAQRASNLREFVLSRMFRGGVHLVLEGDRWIPTSPTGSAGTLEIPFRVPAANRADDTNFGGTAGTGTVGSDWTAAGGTPITNVMTLNQTNVRANGFPLRHGWVSTTVWNGIINTTEAKNVAGTANRVFTQQTPTGPNSADGRQDSGFIGILEGMPWFTWHIIDNDLTVNGASGPVIPDDRVIITPNPSPEWLTMKVGSEMVREQPGSQSSERFAFSAWTEMRTQPTAIDLLSLDIFLPALKVPSTVYYLDATA